MNEAKRRGAEVAEENAEKKIGAGWSAFLIFSAFLSLRPLPLRISMNLHCRMTGSRLVISGRL
jgi:hypothetical protein